MKNVWITGITALFLAACASGGNTQTPAHNTAPNAKWKQLGYLGGGNIELSYDSNNVVRLDNGHIRVYDRKTIAHPEKTVFRDTPEYKTATGEWLLNCSERTYRLLSMRFVGKNKHVLLHRYENGETRFTPIQPATGAQALFDAVCPNPTPEKAPI